jgi:hypothetical protein
VIKAWSYSRLSVFEQCPLRAKLAYIDKIPEPERPLPPGKTEHANDRGTRIHEAAEMFVRGGVELLPELQSFKDEFENLRSLYHKGKVSLEGEWGITQEWKPVAWMDRNVWLRVKLDAMVRLDPEQAVVIDYKTGKKAGNEVKHAEQGQLYAVGTANRNPEIEQVTVEFWYTDQDDITSKTYDLGEIDTFRQKFHERGIRITSATDFEPRPNMFNCRWCPYGPKGTGHCKVGIQK